MIWTMLGCGPARHLAEMGRIGAENGCFEIVGFFLEGLGVFIFGVWDLSRMLEVNRNH